MSNYQDPRNSTFQPVSAFSKQMVLNHTQQDPEEARRALTYLDKHAPDLVAMVLGGVL